MDTNFWTKDEMRRIKKFWKGTFVALWLLLVIAGIGFTCYDSTPTPKAPPDLTAYILKTPADVYKKHGYSERTDIMYNLAKFKELYLDSEKQMQALFGKIKRLEDKVAELMNREKND